MRRTSAAILAIALLAGFASTASAQRWKYPPGPPYRTCPDTLGVFDVQQSDTTIAPCHPATLDTVLGVRGIITGFDARSSAYGFYMQTAGGGDYTGVDVFTGATNYNASVPGTPTGGNLALGDLVVIYGTTQEFPNPNGETEIEGPDTIQGTNDIIIRKLSSGNPIPPFKVGTTHDFNWVPSSPGNLGEPNEGNLVKIRGPLRVARTTGLGLLGNNWLIVSVAAPSPDSVMIDGFTLCTTAVGTPAVGTVIDSIQGILNQRTSGSPTANSYRIQLRNGNDMFLAVPPNLVEAFPVEDNILRLTFDRNVDVPTAQNAGHYSLGSGIDGSTVNTATVVGGSGQVVELSITSVLSDGDNETVTSSAIGSATCPTCLSGAQSLSFVNGVLDVDALQAPLPDSLAFLANRPIYESAGNPSILSPCVDRSKFAGPGTAFGPRLTFRGVHTQSYGSLYYVQREIAGGSRRGIVIFGPSTALTVGHKYKIAGRVQEFGGETEIVNTVYIIDEGVGTVPAPITKPISVLSNQACDQGQNLDTGEDYEGMLVHVDDARVVPFNTDPIDPSAGGSFRIVQPGASTTAPDTILVSSLGNHYTFDADPGDRVDVTGVLHEDGTFRILPRSNADIVFEGPWPSTGVGDGTFDLALSVAPNPGISHHINFALPTKSAVELGVFDLAGRRVAVIASGVMEAGPHSATWNGLGTSGAHVGAGVYFYRLKVGNEVRMLRAVKLN
jgi:hypothetical protein